MKYCLFGFVLWCVSFASYAVLKIEITEGVEGTMPIAVVPFQWQGGARLADADVSAIIASDLARSGKFSPLSEADLIARPQKHEDVHFKTWRVAGIDHLVIGGVEATGTDNFQVQFRLIDILKGEQVLGYSFAARRDTLRSVAHRISDYIIQHITGLGGVFDSRIAYVTTQQQPGKKVTYSLQVADTDGFNPQTLLTSKEPMMSPTWSPNGKRLSYVSFEHGKAEIFIHDIYTAKRESISSFAGINGAPVWSPDGKRMAMTLSKDGNADIYVLNLADKSLQRVTRHWSIDTEASWMPDGKSLVFTSGRSGKPQLYLSSIEPGSRPQRLTFEGNYNANPCVSNDGETIAFVQGENNSYKIAVLHTQTRLVQIVTEGPLDESPEFAPNGSMILYASQDKGRAVLAAVSTDGRHKQKLVLSEAEVREPSWAPVRN